MVTVTIKDKKGKNYLSFFAVFVIALVVAFFVWKAFLAKPAPVPPEIAEKYVEIKINFTALMDPILKELQRYAEIEPLSGDIGRKDPFSPY